MPKAHRRHDISDRTWSLLEPHLPGRKGSWGGLAKDNRLFINAVFWIMRTGAPWRDLPPAPKSKKMKFPCKLPVNFFLARSLPSISAKSMAQIVSYSVQKLMLDQLSATLTHIYPVLSNYLPVPRKVFAVSFHPKTGRFPCSLPVKLLDLDAEKRNLPEITLLAGKRPDQWT